MKKFAHTAMTSSTALQKVTESHGSQSLEEVAATITGRIDLFGHHGQAKMYREFRPKYPDRLVESVVSGVDAANRGLYVDIACGPGTLTERIAPRFNKTIGIDQSFEQLRNAAIVDGCDMSYIPGSAFAIPVEGKSVDLLTVGQGLHWLLPYGDFFKEVDRVLRPGGVFTAIAYAFPKLLNQEAQRAVEGFYFGLLGGHLSPGQEGCWWETNRPTIDKFYEDVPFPKSVERKDFPERVTLELDNYINYLRTLSAYRTLIRAGKEDPLPKLRMDIFTALGSKCTEIECEIPFFTVSYVV